MATGYTHKIADGQTFEDFVWTCARAFGALVTLRDSSEAEIPDELMPSDHYKHLEINEQGRLATLLAMTPDDAETAATLLYQQQQEAHARRIEKVTQLRSRYEDMIAKVEAWNPPTADHVELKSFMLQQLRDSLDFDCVIYDWRKPLQNGNELRLKQIAECKENIAQYQKEYAYEVERTRSRNKWLRELRESLNGEMA